MSTREKNSDLILISIAGAIPVIWVGLLIAPYSDEGILSIISHMSDVLEKPYDIEVNGSSIRTVLLLLLIYAFGIGVYLSSRKNFRRGEEHGSARWGVPALLNKRYADRNYFVCTCLEVLYFDDALLVGSDCLDLALADDLVLRSGNLLCLVFDRDLCSVIARFCRRGSAFLVGRASSADILDVARAD